ncbi:hypothetical protein [Arthrobacter wenxiniae]|uniref:Uncharacterized protein n=1 Tax=Arthrobacter wenxiniae TaxID=2713570 RepID=A0A7Y7IG44_9MICC|nr:hypothetical protein [Arthrobacter wenxiniae]NVM94817.1 hypothetical protein [Arthrobacter wenxiniae]
MATAMGSDSSGGAGSSGPSAEDLLRRADAARRSKSPDADELYLAACRAASQSGQTGVLVSAALALVGHHRFGTPAGTLPALLHQAYSAAGPPERGRLAVALARLWVYAGEAARAAPFAAEALDTARASGDPDDVAAALEAGLLTHWGPDDFGARTPLCAELEELTAHTADVDLRLRALCWALTSALERLDGLALQRRLRDLELLARQSGAERALFYSQCRRAMAALLAGRTGEAEQLAAAAAASGARAGEADAYAVEHALGGEIARQLGHAPALLRAEAARYEDYATTEGVPSILAQAAILWLDAGEPGHASVLARRIMGDGFAGIPRDVDWLLTATQVAEVATRTGDRAAAALMAGVLEPYAGRGVVNAAAVSFHGVVDHYLAGAYALLGDGGRAEKHRAAAENAYAALGADWWAARLAAGAGDGTGDRGPAAGGRAGHRGAGSRPGPSGHPAGALPAELLFAPGTPGIWQIGRKGAAQAFPARVGFSYLRLLLRNPGKDIASVDLVSGFDRALRADQDTGGPVLDPRALAAYRRRLAELDEEIGEAEDWNDPDRAAAARSERQEFIHQLAAARGLLGRPRALGPASERARTSVRKAVAAALEGIAAAEPDVARLLRDGISTGRMCRYEPDPSRPVRWLTDPAPRE